MKHYSKQLGIRVIVLVLVIGTLLIGGASITRAATLDAIPGDTLYPVKTAIEQTRLTLAQDAGDRAQMKIRFADQRLEEIAALIENGRYHLVSEAVLAFEADINSAILELETIAQVYPTRASEIALEITAALTRYAQTLSVMASNAPDSVQQEVTRALDTAKIAAGLELPEFSQGFDDNAKGNDNANSNGNDDNSNGDDANSNGDDDNANSNGNDDNSNGDDDNANSNGNDDNSNGDDDNANSNSDDDNANSNGNDDNANSNDNDDDKGGGEDNSNDN